MILLLAVQWETNQGRCGVCGDADNIPKPRPHEAGGQFAKGIISRRYSVGQVINFVIFIIKYLFIEKNYR